jgi:hypothetical protein
MKTLISLTLLPVFLTTLPDRLAAQVVRLDLVGQVAGYDVFGIAEPQNFNLLHDTTYNPGASASGTAPFGGSLSMFGSAMPGILQASVSGAAAAHTTYSPERGNVTTHSVSSGLVRAYSTEQLTLSVPGIADGTHAVVSFSYLVPASYSADSTGDSSRSAEMSFWSISGHHSDNALLRASDGEISHGFTVQGNGGHSSNLPESRLISYERLVAIGSPFLQSQNLYLYGGSFGRWAGTASIGVSANAYWNGVSQVTVGGVPVSGYSLVNSDGVDFNNSFAPVPEPAHYAGFAAAGLLAFGLWRRHSRRA